MAHDSWVFFVYAFQCCSEKNVSIEDNRFHPYDSKVNLNSIDSNLFSVEKENIFLSATRFLYLLPRTMPHRPHEFRLFGVIHCSKYSFDRNVQQ